MPVGLSQPDRQGPVLGLLSATIGGRPAVGPPLGGVLSEVFGWGTFFLITAFAVLVIHVAIKVFPRDESRSDDPLDPWRRVPRGSNCWVAIRDYKRRRVRLRIGSSADGDWDIGPVICLACGQTAHGALSVFAGRAGI
ncbi:MAG TPA: hypothetical protein DCQ11_11560 [Gammaproteobacteria bacterium]|nr:hypothetical protein [Gammaproteobacteria bacterium]